MTTIAVGNYLKLNNENQTLVYRFQNFHIGQNASFDGETYTFAPFGFSGVSVNRTGDNTEAALLFPNNQLTRSWAVDAINEGWIATVFVMSLDPDDRTTGTKMHQYVGQVSAGSWDESSLSLDLGTILDSVGSDVPVRRLTQSLIGNIPVSSGVRLR